VYSRQIDGREINLVPSGWTYNHTFVLYDKETGSLWYPKDKGLMSIQGIYFKRKLPGLTFEDTHWQEWVKKHPHSKIMR
jgi:hypothetical protein